MSVLPVPPVSALADVAALVGADGWLTPPMRPMVRSATPKIGRVRTLCLAVSDVGPGMGPIYELLSEDLSDCVVVVAGVASLGGAIWGEILSLAAHQAGAIGVVVDGWVRDRSAMEAIGMPVFGRGERVVGPAGRAHVIDVDAAVHIDGVRIGTKDAIAVDGSGCMRILAAREWELLDAARQYAAAEDRVVAALRDGTRLRDAYRFKKDVVASIQRAAEASSKGVPSTPTTTSS